MGEGGSKDPEFCRTSLMPVKEREHNNSYLNTNSGQTDEQQAGLVWTFFWIKMNLFIIANPVNPMAKQKQNR